MKTTSAILCFAFALALLLTSKPATAQDRPMGTDVSSYQPSVNWTTVKNDGVYFAWTKATEGTYYQDAYFASHETDAVAAGVLIGAYHYARPSIDTNITGTNYSADTEAQYFWSFASNYVKGGGAYLVPMLDWEDPSVTDPGLDFTVAKMSAWVNEWCNSVSNYARSNGVAVRPVVYTGQSYGDTWLNETVTNWPSWIAAYPYCKGDLCGSPTPQTSSPGGSRPWPTWNIWQYGDTNWSGGDSDVFNGTTNQFLQLFLVGSTNAPRITTNPPAMTVAQGANAVLSVSASGGTPLYYNWEFNGTNVAAVTNYNTNSVQYALADVQLTNAGAYVVQISNAYGTVLTAPAFLSVTAPLSNAPGSVVAPAGMVDWWPANGNAIDIVSGYNGLPTGGFYYGSGQSGLAFHFNGATSYLTITNFPADVPVPWTACMWVYRQQTPQSSAVLLSDDTNGLKLEQYDNTHEVGISELGVEDWSFSPAYSVPLSTWTHLAFVASGSTTTLYVNGVQEGAISVTLPLGRRNIGVTRVSSAEFVDYLEGSVDEVMIFNVALTAVQIQSIYNAGEAGLVQAPQFLGVSSDGRGNFIYGLEGLTGSGNFIVEYSTNLPFWSMLTNLSAATGANQFTVTPTNAATFYRVVQPSK